MAQFRIKTAAVAALAAALPETTLLLLDEAHGEFAPRGALPPIDTGCGNALRLRTFKNLWAGRPALRLRHRRQFGVSSIAQAASLAALADQDYLASVVTRKTTARRRIESIARHNGLVPLPSATNFMTVDCCRGGAFASG